MPRARCIYRRPAIEELIRWRLWDRTGAGLMAELGSHQLDAAGIFIHAMHGRDPKAEKPHPLSVAAAANRPLFPADRDVEDHVYCIFEFPAPGYDPDRIRSGSRKKIGVQYASINGNGFGGYGETVFGTEGTLLLETEKEAMLYKTHDTTRQDEGRGGQERRTRKTASPCRSTRTAIPNRPPSAPWAHCPPNAVIPRSWNTGRGASATGPRRTCRIAIPRWRWRDAVIALTANLAARQGARIEFKKEWFDIDSDETPEGEKPDITRYK